MSHGNVLLFLFLSYVLASEFASPGGAGVNREVITLSMNPVSSAFKRGKSLHLKKAGSD
jgi:hypothetical protein